jgi:hypothetical protein
MDRILPLIFSFLLLSTLPVTAQNPTASNSKGNSEPAATLQVDPLLIAEAGEVWQLIASPNNPIWPGWDASTTPLLFYLPEEQDVLINHPHPPAGFIRYNGPIQFPGGQILLRDGSTFIDADGQNTSQDVEGVRTLVVADTLSNLRSQVSSLLQDQRPTAEKIRDLSFADLATDPYGQLAMVAHEAFHVFQDRQAPDKGANEMLLFYYPVLSVSNNVGFALEGLALADALHTTDPGAFRRATVRWLAVRRDRRSGLPPQAVEYEDGVEFTEGLAKYSEYRLFQSLEGRRPGPTMLWAQGFNGYASLAPQREKLLEKMKRNMSGEVAVNGDPYGTAPLRMRLYYSGMAIGVILDRISPGWKNRIFAPDATLTTLAEEALKAAPVEMEKALQEAKADPAYASLVQSKTKLAQEGKEHTEAALKEIEEGPGIGLIVDYSKLGSPKLGLSFTPFGITVVDGQRTIFSQVPLKVTFGDECEVAQKVPLPLLRDTERKLVRFRLLPSATRADVEKALGPVPASGGPISHLAVDLPGAFLKAENAQISWNGDNLIVSLLKGNER